MDSVGRVDVVVPSEGYYGGFRELELCWKVLPQQQQQVRARLLRLADAVELHAELRLQIGCERQGLRPRRT